MDITPDLSHLTADERKIIEAVIHRQRMEERFDGLTRRSSTANDYSAPPPSVTSSHRSSQSNIESGVVCQLCQKTKFVQNQSSRQCYICHRRFCIRCGIRLKNQTYLCYQCREKQEIYFSSKKQQLFPKQYLSDYILTQTQEPVTMTKTVQEDEISSPDSITADERPQRKLPEIKLDPRSNKLLKDFRFHSLEEKESGQDSTLKDSGIDTASSSTILNVIPADPYRKSITNWRWNESRTEQMGFIYLKNPLPISDNDQDQIDCDDLFHALGLFLEPTMHKSSQQFIPEIIRLTRGSLADTYGQLRVGDQVLEWNGDKLVNLSSKEICRLIALNSLQSPHIQLIVRRVFNSSTPITNLNSLPQQKLTDSHLVDSTSTVRSAEDKTPIQIQLSFQYDQKEFYIMIYGAKSLPSQHSLLACQVSVQYENDSLSRDVKCTKAQLCSSNTCTWNQALRFVDIDTLEHMLLTVTLKNLDQNENNDILGQVRICPLNVNSKPDWYSLEQVSPDSSVNRTHPSTTDMSSPIVSSRKRQLPNIPTAQLHVNREKVSQDLLEKATQLKLRLHLQSKTDKPLLTQHSFDQSVAMTKQMHKTSVNIADRPSRQSMVNLANLRINSKDKPKIPMIRDKSTPNTVQSRRGTMINSARTSMDKTVNTTIDEKYRKTIKNRDSSATTGDEIDSDGSELSTPSKVSSTSMFSNQSDRPRVPRKIGLHSSTPHPHLHREDEIQLNEEELRQMAMRTHDTFTHHQPVTTDTTSKTTTLVNTSNPTGPQQSATPPVATTTETKTIKADQRQDGTLSDSVLSSQPDSNKKRRPSMSSKALVILGLSKKANSASNLGITKRSGFQRSEEIGVQPHLRNRTLIRQTSKENETPASAPATQPSPSPFALSHQREQCHSIRHDMKLWSGSLNLPHERPFAEFIEGLGPGQVVGRQVLASPCHGEIQVGLRIQQGLLEVEIVRARKLLKKALYASPPASYVKVYLLDGKTCLEKQRTPSTRRTLDPLIQKILIFKENFRGKILQISIWGDYGKLDRKVFMGVCQINLDEMNFDGCQQNLSWYKLFSANSLISTYTTVQTLNHRKTSVNSHDSS